MEASPPNAAAPASGAANQLDHAFGGPTTGTTFDGGRGPSDAVLPDEDKAFPHPPTPPSSASGPDEHPAPAQPPAQPAPPPNSSSASDSAQGDLIDTGNGQNTGRTFDHAVHDQIDDAIADPANNAPPQGPPTPPEPPHLAPIDAGMPSAPPGPEAGTSNAPNGASSGAGGSGASNPPVQGSAPTRPANSEYTTYGPGDERTTGTGVNRIEGGGHPISGPGIVQGTPDRRPPPNPVPPVPATGNQSLQPIPRAPIVAPPPARQSPSLRPSPSQNTQPEPPRPSYQPTDTGSAAPSVPSVSPAAAPVSSDPRLAEARGRVATAQIAVANSQRELRALLAQRKTVKLPAQRKRLDTLISAQRSTLASAQARLGAAEHDLQLLSNVPAK